MNLKTIHLYFTSMVLVVTCVYKDDYNNVLRFCEKHNLKLVVYNKNDDLKVNEEIIKINN